MEIITIEFESTFEIIIKGQSDLTAHRNKDHGSVRFGVNAPRSCNVDREEVYLKKQHINNKENFPPTCKN